MLPASTEGNALPTASFTVTPNPAAVTREIVLDASGSSDADGSIVRYDWDLNGDGEFEALGGSSPRRVVAFAVPGERVVGLRVLDAQGGTATTTRTVVVRANARPAARFTATPNPARVGQPIGLNASGSSDPEGAIARYEWDLDGNGSFETSNGADSTRTVSYSTEGERLVGLRVTDADGATNSTTETVSVLGNALASPAGRLAHSSALPAPPARAPGHSSALPAPPARAPGHATGARAASLPFMARLTGGPLPGRRGTPRRRGSRVSLGGIRAGGRLRTRLMVTDSTRAVPGRRALERLLKARWRARINLRLNRQSKRMSATATALARPRRGSGSAACLRIRVSVRPGAHPTARFTLLAGTGAAARLRATGSGRLRLERDGSATILGRLRTRTGGKRSLPRACQTPASRGRR